MLQRRRKTEPHPTTTLTATYSLDSMGDLC